MKKILKIKDAPAPHWVGDGFPVRSMFSYHNPDRFLSPFLLLDHAGPAHFDPAVRPRGVGQQEGAIRAQGLDLSLHGKGALRPQERRE